MLAIQEKNRETPVSGTFDVIVCGGGPAGTSAAIYSSRMGARTFLIESQGFLGGIWTAGLLCYVLDADKQGFIDELIRSLENGQGEPLNFYRSSQKPWVKKSFFYDPELMKWVLEQKMLQVGVSLRYHTRVVSAIKDQENHLTHVITESKSGREAWAAKVFIDATGDGDVAAQAGCGFDFGRPGTQETQPFTMMALVSGIVPEQVVSFINGHENNPDIDAKLRMRDEIAKGGSPSSYSLPSLFHIRENLFALMANHEYGLSAINADNVTLGSIRSRDEIHRIINQLRSLGGVWGKLRLVATGAQIGIREGRRIHGLYTVSAKDLIEGASQPDAVCRVTFPVDVHSPDPQKGSSYSNEGVQSQPYDIPLRSLIAADVKGLMMTGRCISGDFFAHSSYRVTGNAVVLGEAAGVAAALAANKNYLPQDVSFQDVHAGILNCRHY